VANSVGDALVDFVTHNNGKVQGVSVVPMGEVGYGLVANQVTLLLQAGTSVLAQPHHEPP
jgi:hypothetical protein